MLENKDLNNLPEFVEKLKRVPFQIKINQDKGSFARQARRLCIKNDHESVNTRFAFPHMLPALNASS